MIEQKILYFEYILMKSLEWWIDVTKKNENNLNLLKCLLLLFFINSATARGRRGKSH